jgi:hypothetical protein
LDIFSNGFRGNALLRNSPYRIYNIEHDVSIMFNTIKACLLLFFKYLERMSKVISLFVGIEKATWVSKRGICL